MRPPILPTRHPVLRHQQSALRHRPLPSCLPRSGAQRLFTRPTLPAFCAQHHPPLIIMLYLHLKGTGINGIQALQAAIAVHQSHLITADAFSASETIALVFDSADYKNTALSNNLAVGDLQLELHTIPAKTPKLRKLTLDRVCTQDLAITSSAIYDAISNYGRVVEIVPLVWEGTNIATTTWHVTCDLAEYLGPQPPETIEILGHWAVVDIPGLRRICRVCNSSEHTNPACRIGQRAQQQKQHQQQPHNQQRSQKQGMGPGKKAGPPASTTTNKTTPKHTGTQDPSYFANLNPQTSTATKPPSKDTNVPPLSTTQQTKQSDQENLTHQNNQQSQTQEQTTMEIETAQVDDQWTTVQSHHTPHTQSNSLNTWLNEPDHNINSLS